MIDGLIAVWKEQDFTSHDVVAKLRGILRQKKIGHTGTLDPKAEGVLVVGLGSGTKACGLLPKKDKIYRAGIRFGIATDTQDIWGTVQKEEEVQIDREAFCSAIMSFEGIYMQTPPMYSAKKVNGRKLYELARQGKTVERKAVCVTIRWIRVLEFKGTEAIFEVCCSEGTYIRTLCEDIGKKLGVCACMSSLIRLEAGGFGAEQALTLAQIELARDNGTLASHIVSIEKAFSSYPCLVACEGMEKPLLNGNSVSRKVFGGQPDVFSGIYRIRLADGCFVGLYEWSDREQLMVPYKMFCRIGGEHGSPEAKD